MRGFLKWFFVTFIAVIITIGIGYFFIPTDRFEKTDDIHWGVTFSKEYANDLGLNWKDTYTRMFEDLDLRSVRVVTYWNELEPVDDEFNFDDIDWQIEQAQLANATVLLTVGYKQPRWPECRKPDWLNDNRDDVRRELREYIEMVINRYKDNETVFAWQVENEPFLPFGVCLDLGKNFYEEEVALVKSLDNTRPIVVTESGELSLWRHGPKTGATILGVTTYRVVWNPWLGRISWGFLTPDYYRKKAQLINEQISDFFFVELQAEPWGPAFVTEMPLEQQKELFSVEQLRKNITFGKETGFKNTYLWGVEWWYYMKQIHEYGEVLDAVRDEINR